MKGTFITMIKIDRGISVRTEISKDIPVAPPSIN
jgi:hypothetical protein